MNSIDVVDFKQKLVAEEDIIILDVREKWEYEEENIGAINLPLCTIPGRLDELEHLKDKEVICHCKTGKRSHQAAKYLNKHGFTNVKSLNGGITAYLSLYSKEPD